MAKTLIVRHVAADVVRALKEAAAKHGRQPEDEHREILRAALVSSKSHQLSKALARIPDVGLDADFERSRG